MMRTLWALLMPVRLSPASLRNTIEDTGLESQFFKQILHYQPFYRYNMSNQLSQS